MTRPTQRQIEQFEAKLHKATRNSVEVSDTLLKKLAARRDAYLSNLRWLIELYKLTQTVDTFPKMLYIIDMGEEETSSN